MSIDREINSRVDAFGSNPQVLQKRYAATKELVDLLALQRIKSQKDDVTRQIQMEMQTNPATIKQQREQEIMGRTAQEVAQQVGGVLQTAKNQKKMAQRRPAPQGLGALMPQQGQRPQQPQRMQAGGIVAFQKGNLVKPLTSLEDLPDKGVSQEQLRTVARAQIKELLEGGVSPEVIKQEVPPQYVGLVDEVVQTSRATAPPGPMEEVVVTGQRERAQPVQTVDKPSSKEAKPVSPGAKIDVTDYSQLLGPTETRRPKEEKPTPKKVAPKKKTFSKPEGAIETLFGEQGYILPLGLTKESGIRDRVQYAIDTNKPLSSFSADDLTALRSDNDQYTPKIEAELARRQPQPKQGIAAVAEETTGAPQAQPPRAEGIAAVAEQPKGVPSDTPLIFRDQQNVPAGTAPSGTAGTAPSKPQGYDLQAGLDSVGEAPTPVMVDRTGLEKRGVDFTKAYGVDPASIDPEEAGIEALTKAGGFYQLNKKDAEARQGLADLAAIDAAQTDPNKLRRDRLKAFLLGGANRGSSALAASGAASMNLGRAQERDVRARQIKRNEMLRTIQDKDTEVRKLAKGEEKAAMERADRIKMDGLQIISNMSTAELSARQTEARVINESNIAGYQQKIQRVELLMEDAQNKLDNAIEKAKLESMDASRRGQIANAGIDDAMRRMTEVDKILSEVYQNQAEADNVLRNLNMQLAGADNEADMERIKGQIENRQKEIKGSLAISHGNLYDEMDSLNSKILSLESMRNSALGGSSPNIALNPQDKNLIDMFSSMPQ
ncbi:MAG: hypothetical protein CMJ25_15825 [Phycisphaerae bacterium]|nr:hypothetical protein [Phycisphaerae bacterium]